MLLVLAPFMGHDLNYTMVPTGGGFDAVSVGRSPEPGCLELLSPDGLAEMFRPATLFFEYFPDSEWNSFFLIETHQLEPCGVYREGNWGCEEVVEISPGKYVHPSHQETGVVCDEEGRDIPLPRASRIVTRHMRGKFIIVAKRSIWNAEPTNADGRHSRMTAQQIRTQIQRVVEYYRPA